MEKKMKIFLMMIGLMGLVFVNACEEDDPGNKADLQCHIYDCFGSEDSNNYDPGQDDNNTNDELNDEMEDDVGTDPGHDPGTDPGVDAEQDPGSDDSGNDPGNQTCAEGERRVNIDGETPCLPIKTAETLEYFENHKNDNEGRGLKFKYDGDPNHDFYLQIYSSEKYFGQYTGINCQDDGNDPVHFIIHGTSPVVELCVHNSRALSLCKNDASVCGDSLTYFVQEGKIFLSEGLYNVEFVYKCSDPDCLPEGSYRLFQEVPPKE